MTTPNFTSCDAIRSRFSCELSRMYRAEVPQYGVLLDLVERVNEDALRRNARAREKGEQLRLDIERHGAIRVGTAVELATMRCAVFDEIALYEVEQFESLRDVRVAVSSVEPAC
jgi:uncharacterized glyoxalase superfamily metalloenzyme YdcJ